MASFRIDNVRVWGGSNSAVASCWLHDGELLKAPRDNVPYTPFDADGAYISPGFIDTHVHVFKHVTGAFGLDADSFGVRQGVAAVVDQGGPSCITFDAFKHFIVEAARTPVLAFISTYVAGGLVGHRYVGLYGPDAVDVKQTIKTIDANRQLIAGIKVHADHGGFSRWGSALFRLGREISDAVQLPLYIHLGTMWQNAPGKEYDPKSVLDEIEPLVRPGDILAHPFTMRPAGFFLGDGSVHPLIKNARDRGLHLDVGRGYHIDYTVARRMIDAGVIPDTLGSDVHGFNNGPDVPAERRFSLACVMAEMVALGLPVDHVVKMVTTNCGHFLPKDALKPGQDSLAAGFTLFHLKNTAREFTDNRGNKATGTLTFVPIACVVRGQLHICDPEDLPLRLREAA